MNTYALLSANDELIRTQEFEGDAPELAPAKGLRWVPWSDAGKPTVSWSERVYSAGIKMVEGVAQTDWRVEDLDAQQMASHIAQLKAQKNTQINDQREQANLNVFTHLGKQISCDRLSRSDLDGMANQISLIGDFPEGWPGFWKCADNTYLDMATVEDFKAMYASMIAHGLYNFGVSQARKAALAAATTPEEVAAV
jgi:hypothetical protein